MLTKELKDEWVAALRSGNYKQGTGKLKSFDCYCCLGVLACLLEKSNKHKYWYDGEIFHIEDTCSDEMLPKLFLEDDEQEKLIDVNYPRNKLRGLRMSLTADS